MQNWYNFKNDLNSFNSKKGMKIINRETLHRCTEQTFGLCGRRREWDVLKEQHVYYLQWNRSPAQVGCMRRVLGPGALGRPRGIGWRERWEGGLGWGTHVTPWLIHVNVWQNPLKRCEVISLQLIKINETKQNTTNLLNNCKTFPVFIEIIKNIF